MKRLSALLAALLVLPANARAAAFPDEATALAGSLYGWASLAIFIAAYSLVPLENRLEMRKSKPVLIAAGLIWSLVALEERDVFQSLRRVFWTTGAFAFLLSRSPTTSPPRCCWVPWSWRSAATIAHSSPWLASTYSWRRMPAALLAVRRHHHLDGLAETESGVSAVLHDRRAVRYQLAGTSPSHALCDVGRHARGRQRQGCDEARRQGDDGAFRGYRGDRSMVSRFPGPAGVGGDDAGVGLPGCLFLLPQETGRPALSVRHPPRRTLRRKPQSAAPAAPPRQGPWPLPGEPALPRFHDRHQPHHRALEFGRGAAHRVQGCGDGRHRNQWKPFYDKARSSLSDLVLEGRDRDIKRRYDHPHRHELAGDSSYEAAQYFDSLGDDGRYLLFSAAPGTDEDGKLVGAVELFEDVTEHRRQVHNSDVMERIAHVQ